MNELLEFAKSQLGTKEIVGVKHNQTIVNYAKEAGFDWVNDDETPWCSIFVNWVTMKRGYERTHSAAARSWLKAGEGILYPEYGCIVVFKRGNSDWQGHVGFFDGEDDKYIYVVGGNQSNAVTIAKYKKEDLLGYRKLEKIHHEIS